MPGPVRVVVQCASPLLRSVVVRHLMSGSGLTTVPLGDVAGAGSRGRTAADLADVLLQVVRQPTARSMSAAGWAASTGLTVVLLTEGRSTGRADLAEAGRRGVAAVVPLEAVTGELLRSTITTSARSRRDGRPVPVAQVQIRYDRLLRDARRTHEDVRWVTLRQRA